MFSDSQYNFIDNGNDTFTLSLAVPGHRKEDLSLTVSGTTLRVVSATEGPAGRKLVTQYIPDRYDYKFDIGSYDVVDAKCGDGLLDILLTKTRKSGVIQIK